MNMDVAFAQGKVPVTILSLHGAVDGSNYQTVIEKVNQLYGSGTRSLLLDLGDVNFLSSAGLVALHSIILIMRGEKPNATESGWEALHAIDRDSNAGPQANVKLLNPQPRVANTLHISAMEKFFEIFTDQQSAIEAF